MTYLNGCHKSIKFMAEISEVNVPFLDLNVHIEEGKLWTDLYCKPSDSHNYLHYESTHPEYNKKSLPYSQYLRLKRICNKEDDFLKHSQMITFHFVRRGYPKPLLLKAFEKVTTLDRNDIIKRSSETQKENESVFLINTFNPGFDRMKELVTNN